MFVVNATGTALTYQWQQSNDGGNNFTNIGGATSATFTLSNPSLAQNGLLFRVVINGSCTASLSSTAALLTVTEPILITSQPMASSGCAGSMMSFLVRAGGPGIAYQWQVSEAGGAFTNIINGAEYTAANTNTLTITNAAFGMNGNQYRVVVSGTSCNTVTSMPALLNVFALPTVSINAASVVSITPYQPVTLTSSTSPGGVFTYAWLKNGSLLPGATSSSIPVNIDGLGTYRLRVTDGRGCSNLSNLVTVADTASTLLFIYPNPSNGQFQVRYYQAGNSTTMRTLNIYDARGARIFTKQYTTSGGYQQMNINIGFRPSPGTYFADLRAQSGKRLASAAIRIQ